MAKGSLGTGLVWNMREGAFALGKARALHGDRLTMPPSWLHVHGRSACNHQEIYGCVQCFRPTAFPRSCGSPTLANARRVEDVFHDRRAAPHSRGAGLIMNSYVLWHLLDECRRAPGAAPPRLAGRRCHTGESWSKMRPPVLGNLLEWCPHCATDLIYV